MRDRATERTATTLKDWLFANLYLTRPKSINRPAHGPSVWPRWKLFSISVVRQDRLFGGIGWNIWVYWQREGEAVISYKGIVYFNSGICIELCIIPKKYMDERAA